MSSFPFPDFPSELADGPDDVDPLQHGLSSGTTLASPPPMLHHAASSPSLNHAAAHSVNTPAESVALSINYQSSGFSEFGDPDDASFFNAIFGTTSADVPSPSLLSDDPVGYDLFSISAAGSIAASTEGGAAAAWATGASSSSLAPAQLAYTTPEPVFHDAGKAAYPISPDQTPSLNAPSSPSSDSAGTGAGFAAAAAAAAAHKFAAARSIASVAGFDGLVSPQQLTKVPPSTATSPPQLFAFVVSDVATQLTPDTTSSGGSLGQNDRSSLSTDGSATATTVPPMSGPNPAVTVSLWGKDGAQDESYLTSSDIKTERAGSAAASAADGDSAVLSHTATAGSPSPTASRRRGLDPASRPSAEMATSLNEDAEKRKVQEQNAVVSQWLDSSAGGEPADATAATADLDAAAYQDEAAAGAAAAAADAFEGVSSREIDLGGETQNNEQPGGTYLAGPGGPLTSNDYEIMLKSSSIWEDRPSVLRISRGFPGHQPESSQAAIERFERMYHDNASIVSRAATWGTRRRSLPSIADIEGITSGNFLKKLAISRGPGERRPSIFDGLRTLVRMPSTNQQLKRSRGIPDDDAASFTEASGYTPSPPPGDDGGRRDSTKSSSNTLGVPSRTQSWGKNKQPMPSINTALISMGSNMASIGATHARSGSISRPHAGSVSVSPPLTSPKSPLLKVGNSLRRPRSKSDTKGTLDNAQSNIVRMLKKTTGGPPVASLATANATPTFPGPTSAPSTSAAAAAPPAHAPATAPAPIKIPATRVAVTDPDDEDDDDDDDEGGAEAEGDLKAEAESEELIDQITPDFNGFRELVLRLNPQLAKVNTYLVDRIAHQQIVRYKGLLQSRIKHLGQVKAQQCASGSRCIAQGGLAVMLDSKGQPRSMDPMSTTYDASDDGDDVSSPLDGAINAESFPKYIPMPPTSSLPAEFECQLCFQCKRFQKPSDWTKHVHEDVQPFTCTWDRCRDPKMFKRKADWVRHENEGHRRLEWWTCDVDECRHTCYRRDNFLQHLVREHKFSEPKHKTKAAIKRAGADFTWQRVEQCHVDTSGRPQDEPCRFCGKTFPTWKKLTVHLAKHMEHISLPILRLVERKEVEADTLISPVQDPPPRSFAPIGGGGGSGGGGALPTGYGGPMEHQGMVAGLQPNMMAAVAAAASGAGFHPHHLGGQPLGYGGPHHDGAPDPTAYSMYPGVTQVQYHQQAYYGQPSPFAGAGGGGGGGLPAHMQSLDAATMGVSSGLGGGPAYGHPGHPHHLSAVGSNAAAAAANSHAYLGHDGVGGMDAASYSAFSAANALGLQVQAPLSSSYDAASIDPSMSGGGGSTSEHYNTPQGSVSPFGHSPHQPQGQFYGQ